VSGKAERFPRRLVRRLTDEQRRALDELRFSHPGPARRGELKGILGWKRTREETTAIVADLLDKGMILSAVAARLDVDKRYLAALLKREATSENPARKPPVDAEKSATNLQALTAESFRGPRPAPASGFRSFRELDAWLGEGPA